MAAKSRLQFKIRAVYEVMAARGEEFLHAIKAGDKSDSCVKHLHIYRSAENSNDALNEQLRLDKTE